MAKNLSKGKKSKNQAQLDGDNEPADSNHITSNRELASNTILDQTAPAESALTSVVVKKTEGNVQMNVSGSETREETSNAETNPLGTNLSVETALFNRIIVPFSEIMNNDGGEASEKKENHQKNPQNEALNKQGPTRNSDRDTRTTHLPIHFTTTAQAENYSPRALHQGEQPSNTEIAANNHYLPTDHNYHFNSASYLYQPGQEYYAYNNCMPSTYQPTVKHCTPGHHYNAHYSQLAGCCPPGVWPAQFVSYCGGGAEGAGAGLQDWGERRRREQRQWWGEMSGWRAGGQGWEGGWQGDGRHRQDREAWRETGLEGQRRGEQGPRRQDRQREDWLGEGQCRQFLREEEASDLHLENRCDSSTRQEQPREVIDICTEDDAKTVIKNQFAVKRSKPAEHDEEVAFCCEEVFVAAFEETGSMLVEVSLLEDKLLEEETGDRNKSIGMVEGCSAKIISHEILERKRHKFIIRLEEVSCGRQKKAKVRLNGVIGEKLQRNLRAKLMDANRKRKTNDQVVVNRTGKHKRRDAKLRPEDRSFAIKLE